MPSISASTFPILKILVPEDRGENSEPNLSDDKDPAVNSIIFFGPHKEIDFFQKLSLVNIVQN